MATGDIQLPQEPSVSRRDLLLGATAGFVAGGFSTERYLSSRSVAPQVIEPATQAAIDPFWTEGIWQDTTNQLRQPRRGPQPKLTGSLEWPDLLPAVYAQNPAPEQTVQHYHFPDDEQRFRLPAEVKPEHARGPVCFAAELRFFNPSRAQFEDKQRYATFRMDVGTALNPTASPYGLFMTGMNVFHAPRQGADLNQRLFGANPPIIIPDGTTQLRLLFWRSHPKSWWTRIFGFIEKAEGGMPVLFPSVVIPVAIKEVVDFVNRMIGGSEAADKQRFDYLWTSGANTFAVTQEGQSRWPIANGLRSGLWVAIDGRAGTELDENRDLIISPGRYFLARRQDPHTPVMQDFNYLVWHCRLQPTRLATEAGCIYSPAG